MGLHQSMCVTRAAGYADPRREEEARVAMRASSQQSTERLFLEFVVEILALSFRLLDARRDHRAADRQRRCTLAHVLLKRVRAARVGRRARIVRTLCASATSSGDEGRLRGRLVGADKLRTLARRRTNHRRPTPSHEPADCWLRRPPRATSRLTAGPAPKPEPRGRRLLRLRPTSSRCRRYLLTDAVGSRGTRGTAAVIPGSGSDADDVWES